MQATSRSMKKATRYHLDISGYRVCWCLACWYQHSNSGDWSVNHFGPYPNVGHFAATTKDKLVSNIFQHQKTVINFGVETNSNYLNFVVTYHLSLHANFWRFQSKFYPSNMPGKKGMPVCLYLYAFTCVEAWGTGTLDELEQRKHGPTERFTFWSTHSHCVWLLYYVSLLGCPAYCMDSFKMTILTI